MLSANPHFYEESYWSDGQVRATGREYNGVAASRCFESGKLSCLNCHEMHPNPGPKSALGAWREQQMRSEGASDQACAECHREIARQGAGHTHHTTGSAGSSCINCHLPHSSFGLLRAVRSHQITSPTAEETARWGRPNACNLCHLDQPLAWTAHHLQNWFGQPAPVLSHDQQTVASGALALLKGDALVRALTAWSMGWEPARLASHPDWFTPYLAITLNDHYAAVRFVAWKALLADPAFSQFSFDYTASDHETYNAALKAYEHSMTIRASPLPPRERLLLDARGAFLPEPYQRLLDQRDQSRIYLVE